MYTDCCSFLQHSLKSAFITVSLRLPKTRRSAMLWLSSPSFLPHSRPLIICITYLCHIQLEKSNTSNLLVHLYIIVLIMWNRKTKVSHGHSRHNNMVSLQVISGCLFFIYLLIFMLNKPGKWNIFSVQQHNVWPVWLCCMFMFLYIRGSNLRVSSYAREWSALELLFRISAAM